MQVNQVHACERKKTPTWGGFTWPRPRNRAQPRTHDSTPQGYSASNHGERVLASPHHSHRLAMMQFAIGAWRKFWSKQLMQQSSGTLLKFSVTRRNLLHGCNEAKRLPDSTFQQHRRWWRSRFLLFIIRRCLCCSSADVFGHLLLNKLLFKALQLDVKPNTCNKASLNFTHNSFFLIISPQTQRNLFLDQCWTPFLFLINKDTVFVWCS